ncbi:hypothetical protein DV515_00019846, partial [Chloebia gouldiae]
GPREGNDSGEKRGCLGEALKQKIDETPPSESHPGSVLWSHLLCGFVEAAGVAVPETPNFWCFRPILLLSTPSPWFWGGYSGFEGSIGQVVPAGVMWYLSGCVVPLWVCVTCLGVWYLSGCVLPVWVTCQGVWYLSRCVVPVRWYHLLMEEFLFPGFPCPTIPGWCGMVLGELWCLEELWCLSRGVVVSQGVVVSLSRSCGVSLEEFGVSLSLVLFVSGMFRCCCLAGTLSQALL